MLSSILRVLVAFAVASLLAAVVFLGFANPRRLMSPGGQPVDVSALAGFWLAVATHIAIFAAPFALIAAAAGEWLRLRGWLYYVLAGLVVAGMGFSALFIGESPANGTIWNNYAAAAFAAAGVVGGLGYWLAGGRLAGGRLGTAAAAAPALPTIAVAPPEPKTAPADAFRFEGRGPDGRGLRLVAKRKLERADFYKIAEELGSKPRPARKTGFVAARQATETEAVETLWNGKETSNTADPGDWIVTNLTPEKETLRDSGGHPNTYVIPDEKFQLLYEEVEGDNEFGRLYKPNSTVDVLHFPGGFEIEAPWGEKQIANSGYLVLNGKDVYGNNAETFDATYEVVE